MIYFRLPVTSGSIDQRMPTIKMKLFSLLMGNTAPVNETALDPAESTNMIGEVPATMNEEHLHVNEHTPSPHISINLDKLRRIFGSLRADTQEKETDEHVTRIRKHLSILNQKIRRSGRSHSKARKRSFRITKERIFASLNRNPDKKTKKDTKSWAHEQLNRITSSVRHARSESFLAKKKPRDAGEIYVPSMKTKNRSTIETSSALIRSASIQAHKDLVKHLEEVSIEHCIDEIDFRDFDYPFENIVFEGGGAKVHTYIGAIKCLEEANIKWKRLAGTSAGAMTAGLLAVGYSSAEIHILYEYDVEYNVKDGTCGLLSLLPNMFRFYGWNPGERAMRWYGECLAVKTGDPDITFQQIYDRYGVELCIVATNLSTRCEEYFHPKTTPDMPVKLAVRMSSSLPGLFQPVRRRLAGGQGTNVYIDGGLLCNFPVHVFDGWWLSMHPDDVFYKKMGSLENLPKIMERKNRFGEFNNKTLGFCMFSMFDDKALRFELEKRHKLKVTKRPNTKLAQKRMKQMLQRDEREANRDLKLDALNRFFRVLRTCHKDHGVLKKETLMKTFAHLLSQPDQDPSTNKSAFTQAHVDIIFGEGADLCQMAVGLDADEDDTVSSIELIIFLKRHNVDIQEFLGDQILGRVEVSNFGAFFMRIQESLMNSARKVYIQTDDLDRTVGINTDYIRMDDFSLETEDQEFLIQQGYKATAAFLRYWIARHRPKPKQSESCCEITNCHRPTFGLSFKDDAVINHLQCTDTAMIHQEPRVLPCSTSLHLCSDSDSHSSICQNSDDCSDDSTNDSLYPQQSSGDICDTTELHNNVSLAAVLQSSVNSKPSS